MSKSRTICRLTLRDMRELSFYGFDVKPNAHAWVSDESIREALEAGLADDTLVPHHVETNRAARIASYVRMIDAGTLPRKAYAELYLRGTAYRLKFTDGNTRLRAMEFRSDPEPVEVHVFGLHRVLHEFLRPVQIVQSW